MENLIIPRGDYGFVLGFTVLDSKGIPYDLTDYTIKFKVWRPGFPGVLAVNGACNAVSAPDGTCSYAVANGDFNFVGTYSFELELTKAGKVESTVTRTLLVTESH